MFGSRIKTDFSLNNSTTSTSNQCFCLLLSLQIILQNCLCSTGLATDGCDVILPTWASGRWILGNFFTNPVPAVFLNADSDPDADPDKLQRDF